MTAVNLTVLNLDKPKNWDESASDLTYDATCVGMLVILMLHISKSAGQPRDPKLMM